MKMPILGVVENPSYLLLPDTGKRLEVFGKSRAEEMAKAAQSPLLAQLPIDPELAGLCDDGELEQYDSPLIPGFGKAFVEAIAKRGRQTQKKSR